MLVLDDINGLARSDEFANWLKSFVDTVATAKKPLPLFLLLVGLPSLPTYVRHRARKELE